MASNYQDLILDHSQVSLRRSGHSLVLTPGFLSLICGYRGSITEYYRSVKEEIPTVKDMSERDDITTFLPRGKKIFLVDDDRDTVSFYRTLFPIYGYEVSVVAYNGDDALSTYLSLDTKPDVIVLDHRMPGKTGIEVAVRILADDPDARIIMATADRSAMREASRMGIRSFQKPLDVHKILGAIEEI